MYKNYLVQVDKTGVPPDFRMLPVQVAHGGHPVVNQHGHASLCRHPCTNSCAAHQCSNICGQMSMRKSIPHAAMSIENGFFRFPSPKKT